MNNYVPAQPILSDDEIVQLVIDPIEEDQEPEEIISPKIIEPQPISANSTMSCIDNLILFVQANNINMDSEKQWEFREKNSIQVQESNSRVNKSSIKINRIQKNQIQLCP